MKQLSGPMHATAKAIMDWPSLEFDFQIHPSTDLIILSKGLHIIAIREHANPEFRDVSYMHIFDKKLSKECSMHFRTLHFSESFEELQTRIA